MALRTKSQASAHRSKSGIGSARSGKSLGSLLADVGDFHGDLMGLVEGASDNLSAARIERSASNYARAVSRYRTAVLELVTAMQLADSTSATSPRMRCRDVRWQARTLGPRLPQVYAERLP